MWGEPCKHAVYGVKLWKRWDDGCAVCVDVWVDGCTVYGAQVYKAWGDTCAMCAERAMQMFSAWGELCKCASCGGRAMQMCKMCSRVWGAGCKRAVSGGCFCNRVGCRYARYGVVLLQGVGYGVQVCKACRVQTCKL